MASHSAKHWQCARGAPSAPVSYHWSENRPAAQ